MNLIDKENAKKNLPFKFMTVLLSIVLTVIDQFTKQLAVQYIKPYPTISLIKFGDTEALNLTYCENTGMSFSLMEGQRVFLILVPVLLIIAVEFFIFSGKATGKPLIAALAVLAGGGLGNLIDRVFMGYVVDFIDFRLINFAIFNFADICAVLGGIVSAAILIIQESKKEKENAEAGINKPEEDLTSHTDENS